MDRKRKSGRNGACGYCKLIGRVNKKINNTKLTFFTRMHVLSILLALSYNLETYTKLGKQTLKKALVIRLG